jgi:hypothetical protein
MTAFRAAAVGSAFPSFLGGLCVAAVACLDPTPIYVAPFGADASPDGEIVSDAAADVEPASACLHCLESPDHPGPGCLDEITACKANAECQAAFRCMLAHGCLDMGSAGALIQCGLPCAEDAGITGTDPAVVIAENVFGCVITTCGDACHLNPTDASSH